MKLITPILCQGSECVELYLHTPIYLHCVVLHLADGQLYTYLSIYLLNFIHFSVFSQLFSSSSFFSNIRRGRASGFTSPAGANEPSAPHTHTHTHTPVCNSRLIIAVIPGPLLPFISKPLSIQNVNKGNKYLPLPS